jgi:uncharacterized metal-binding protein
MKTFLIKLFYLVALFAVIALAMVGVVLMFGLPGFVFLRGHETLQTVVLAVVLGIPLTVFAVSIVKILYYTFKTEKKIIDPHFLPSKNYETNIKVRKLFGEM